MASDVNERNTDSFNVHTPKLNIECYQKSFKCAGGKVWNGVRNNIQNAPSVEAFTYAYKKMLFLNTGTLSQGSNIIYERFCIILMCTIYFF